MEARPGTVPYMEARPGTVPYMEAGPGTVPYMEARPGTVPYMEARPGTAPYMAWNSPLYGGQAWNRPLYGGQAPSCYWAWQSPSLGEIVPCPGRQWTSLYCLSMCFIRHLASPTSIFALCPLHRKRMGSSTSAGYMQSIPCVTYQEWDKDTPQMLTLLHHFSFLSKALFQPELCVLSPPWKLGTQRCCSELRSVDWHRHALCHHPCGRTPHLAFVAESSCSKHSNTCYAETKQVKEKDKYGMNYKRWRWIIQGLTDVIKTVDVLR